MSSTDVELGRDLRSAISRIGRLQGRVGGMDDATRRQLRRQVASLTGRIDRLQGNTAAAGAWYRWVNSSLVPVRVRLKAEQTAIDVCAVLQLPAVSLSWFEPCPAGAPGALADVPGLQGQYKPGSYSLRLNASMGVAQAAEICAHEVRHFWQHYTGRGPFGEAGEADARKFAAQWMAR